MSKVYDAYEDLRDAQYALQVAQQQFDAADPEHVDIAIHDLKAAELRVDAVVRRAKSEGGEQHARTYRPA